MSIKDYTLDSLREQIGVVLQDVFLFSDSIFNNITLKNPNISLEEVKKIYKDLDKNVLKVFNVKNSMNMKKSYGGTSELNVKLMIKKYKKEIKWN